MEERKKLEADKESLLAAADRPNDNEKAEHGHKVTLISQSKAAN